MFKNPFKRLLVAGQGHSSPARGISLKRSLVEIFGFLGGLLLILSIMAAIPTQAATFVGLDHKSPLKSKAKRSPVYEIQNSFHSIYDLYKDSVVFISTEKTIRYKNVHPFFRDFFGEGNNQTRTRKQSGLGTGFIISEDGYIATNHHVVANMDKIKVKVGDKEYSARVVGTDQFTDIALLKIEGSGLKFKPVYMGDSSKVQVGDWAVAIGNPFGLEKSFTVGVISAAVREVGDDTDSFIQTDASINPGNSGGPLINLEGEVIGVNRMIYSQSGGSLGIGFAIPMNVARDVLEKLKSGKNYERGYIGVSIAPLTRTFAKQLGLKKPTGALVASVVDGGPASEAGLRERDVILEIQGKDVKGFRDLVRQIGKYPVGKTLKVVVWRDNGKKSFFVTISKLKRK